MFQKANRSRKFRRYGLQRILRIKRAVNIDTNILDIQNSIHLRAFNIYKKILVLVLQSLIICLVGITRGFTTFKESLFPSCFPVTDVDSFIPLSDFGIINNISSNSKHGSIQNSCS